MDNEAWEVKGTTDAHSVVGYHSQRSVDNWEVGDTRIEYQTALNGGAGNAR
jgi:hypothetical protein